MRKYILLYLLLLLHLAVFSQTKKIILPVKNEFDKWGYIDTLGKLTIPYKFDSAFRFFEGKALVANNSSEGTEYKFINPEGGKFGNSFFAYAQSYCNGMALVRISPDDNSGIWGYMDAQGQLFYFKDCLEARNFNGGFAPVKWLNGWEFINKKMNTVIHEKFDEVGAFSQGLCPVAFGFDTLRRWGYMNSLGQMVTTTTYLNAGEFHNNLAPVQLKTEVKLGRKTVSQKYYGYIGGNGDLLIPAKYQEASIFSEGLALVKLNGSLLFIDVLGNEEIHLDSGFVASNFHNGFAVLHRPNGNVCFIDKKGNIAFDFGFSLLTDFIEGFAFFTRSNGSQGYIDCSGSIIWETKPIKK